MAKDAIAAYDGQADQADASPLRAGDHDARPQAKSFNTIAFDPLNPKYAYVFTKYFKYLDTPTKTGQVPPGQ